MKPLANHSVRIVVFGANRKRSLTLSSVGKMVNQSYVFDVESFGLTVIIRTAWEAKRNRDKSGFLEKSNNSWVAVEIFTSSFAPVDQTEDELTIMFLNF